MCCFVVLVWFVLSCVIVVFSLLFGLLVFVIGRAGRGSLSHGFSIVTGYCRVVVFELLCMGCFACPRCYCLLCMLDVCVCVFVSAWLLLGQGGLGLWNLQPPVSQQKQQQPHQQQQQQQLQEQHDYDMEHHARSQFGSASHRVIIFGIGMSG